VDRSCTRSYFDQKLSLGHTIAGKYIRFRRYSSRLKMSPRILKASKVHGETMDINRQLVRQGTFEISDLESLMSKPVKCLIVLS
jgi:hypothetical protein